MSGPARPRRVTSAVRPCRSGAAGDDRPLPTAVIRHAPWRNTGRRWARCDQLMAGQYVDVDGIDEFFSAWVSARIAPASRDVSPDHPCGTPTSRSGRPPTSPSEATRIEGSSCGTRGCRMDKRRGALTGTLGLSRGGQIGRLLGASYGRPRRSSTNDDRTLARAPLHRRRGERVMRLGDETDRCLRRPSALRRSWTPSPRSAVVVALQCQERRLAAF